MARVPTKKELQYRNRTPKISKECLNCGDIFVRPPSLSGKYCCSKCYWESMRGKKRKNNKITIKCKFCNKEFKVWKCRIKAGKKFCSKKCATNSFKGRSPWNKGIKSKQVGKNHYNWQGGKTKKALKILHSFEYKLFRESIFKRDKYTCQICGDSTGGNLQVDHIKPRSVFPELTFDKDNCRTLCVNCHKNTSTYLNSNMKREDFNYVN